jgi:hypothetical protein
VPLEWGVDKQIAEQREQAKHRSKGIRLEPQFGKSGY